MRPLHSLIMEARTCLRAMWDVLVHGSGLAWCPFWCHHESCGWHWDSDPDLLGKVHHINHWTPTAP